ncbi:MAG: F0F1 ATP synthase subunit B [Opitutae bacterium]|nr:F0F1 ATP synthase subunit B [Opitutae bacterium]
MIENALILAAAEAAGSQESANQILHIFDLFGLDIRFLVAQIVNFGIVAILLYKFAYKPVLATIEERQKKISDGLQYAEEMKAKLADAEKAHAATLQKAQQEAQTILGEARETAKLYLDKQTEAAAGKSEEIIAKAKEAIDLERNKMLTEVRGEVVRLVIDTTSKVLTKDLSEDEKSRFSKSAAEELATVNS